jgi:hypothetical protein
MNLVRPTPDPRRHELELALKRERETFAEANRHATQALRGDLDLSRWARAHPLAAGALLIFATAALIARRPEPPAL